MNEKAASPSTGRLFGEALEHWFEHQGRFWMLAGPGAVIVAATPYLNIYHVNWLPLGLLMFWVTHSFWVDGAIDTFVEALILYQWFKFALYADWPRRSGLLLQLDSFPWRAFLDARFIAFWIIHLSFVYAFNQAWSAFLWSQMPSASALYTGTPAPWIAYIPGEVIAAARMVALALVFGGFSLFLPARAADLAWGPLTAFREAVGVRGQLIALFLLWGFMTLASAIVARRLAFYIQLKIYPNGPADTVTIATFGIAGGVLGAVIEFVAFYILAHAITRLFVARTDWRPEPLPVPLRLS
jgi:hypothetical protein